MNVRTVSLLACGALAACAAAWLAAKKLHRFAYWITRRDPAEVAALATHGWQIARLEVVPGVTLVGLVRPPHAADARWILFAPGNSYDLCAGFQRELDAVIGDRDLGVAFFAWRGFEASGGVPEPAALRHDLLAEWRWLRARGVPADHIELWGYSLGATLAAQTAADLATSGERPHRLCLLAVGERFDVMAPGLLGRFRTGHWYDLGDALQHLDVPVVIVHGTEDDALPIDGARHIAQRLGARATLHEVAGRGHADLWPELRTLLLP